VDWIQLAQNLVQSSEPGNKVSGSVTIRELLDQLRDSQF
jgi:hypothetical protein